jgi:hypothetical protein
MHSINRLSWLPSAAISIRFGSIASSWRGNICGENPTIDVNSAVKGRFGSKDHRCVGVLKSGRTRTRTHGQWTRSGSSPPPQRCSWSPSARVGKRPRLMIGKSRAGKPFALTKIIYACPPA